MSMVRSSFRDRREGYTDQAVVIRFSNLNMHMDGKSSDRFVNLFFFFFFVPFFPGLKEEIIVTVKS